MSAAVAGPPVSTGGSVAALLRRTTDWATWERFSELAAQVGYCTNPVRVRGELADVDPGTGAMVTTYHTAEEPDGVLLLPCRNRRASVCPSCSRTYAADTWQLVAAGLRGGKGLPASVASHPRVRAHHPAGWEAVPTPCTADLPTRDRPGLYRRAQSA